MPSAPLVSIVVTSYNYARYIGQTIRSVLDQSHSNLQLIIVDDHSTDNSLEVIRSFTDDRITVIASETNEGPYAAYNRGAQLARGEFIGTIDSDDWIAPVKLEKQLRYFEDHPETGILATYITTVDADGQPLPNDKQYQPWFNQTLDFNDPASWICENHFCHASVLMRKSVRDRNGLHNRTLVAASDYEYWARCLLNGVRFQMLPEPLAFYRIHGENITTSRQLRSCIEIAYIFSFFKESLRQTQRTDLYQEGLKRIRMRCEMAGAGETLAELVSQYPRDPGNRTWRFTEFLQDYDERAAKVPGAPRTS